MPIDYERDEYCKCNDLLQDCLTEFLSLEWGNQVLMERYYQYLIQQIQRTDYTPLKVSFLGVLFCIESHVAEEEKYGQVG